MEFDSWDVMDWCLKNYNRGVVIPEAGTLSRQARPDAELSMTHPAGLAVLAKPIS